jgi:nicotinamide-nucleotide amidase
MAKEPETLSPALPRDIEQLALEVLHCAAEAKQALATAESCTGGLLASLLTDVEGRGHCFDRGFITYTDEAKVDLLGVDREILRRDGAVSRPAAEAMVCGALARSSADLAVAITGFAGAGAPGEEPGLVFVAAARRGGEPRVTEHHFGKIGRGDVRLKALRVALEHLAAELEETAKDGTVRPAAD